MGVVNFKDIVNSVLLEYIKDTDLNNTNHWLHKVIQKIYSDLRLNIDEAKLKLIYDIFGGKPGTYISGKNIETSLIAVYDLMHILLDMLVPPGGKVTALAWKTVAGTGGSAGTTGYLDKVQEQYEITGSPINKTVDTWLGNSIEEDEYACGDARVARAYLEAKKERNVLERAAYETYTNMTVLNALLEVVKKRVSAKEKVRTAVLSPVSALKGGLSSVTPFKGLIVDIMRQPESYAAGSTTGPGSNYDSIIQKVMNLKSSIGGQFLNRLVEETDEIYPKTIITLCILLAKLCESLLKREAAQSLSTGGTIVNPADIEIKSPESLQASILKFAEEGKLEGSVVYTVGTTRGTMQITPTKDVYTISRIESLLTGESKMFIKVFKELCVYVSTKAQEKTNLGGALWAASGQSLYGR